MRVALIGAGPSCTAVYLELSRQLATQLSEITIFDPKGVFNSVSFKTETDVVLTNTSVGLTSILSQNDLDFLAWLNDRYPLLGARPQSFVPRRLVREYALSRFRAAKAFLEAFSCPTELVKEEVTNVRGLTTGNFHVETAQRTFGPFDAVILGTGSGFKESYGEYRNSERYIPTPYPESQLLEKTVEAREVLVLGTKLSAIDAALTILNASRDKRIVMASPSGQLPAVRDEFLARRTGALHAERLIRARPPSFLSALVRAAVIDLKALGAEAGGKISGIAPGPYPQLRQDIEDCDAGRNNWQQAIATFVDEIEKLWPYLPEHEQRQLFAKYGFLIHKFAAAFPLQNAKRLAFAIEEGRLSVRPLGDAIPFVLAADGRFEGNAALRGRTFDNVVNATGIDTASFRTAKLYRNLLSRKDLLNVFGGLNVDHATMRLKVADRNALIYAIGGPATGSIFIANHMRSMVMQARKLVQDIASSATLRHESVPTLVATRRNSPEPSINEEYYDERCTA